jgi:hypothetical protein
VLDPVLVIIISVPQGKSDVAVQVTTPSFEPPLAGVLNTPEDCQPRSVKFIFVLFNISFNITP